MNTASFTCDTEGSFIYFTVDGSRPLFLAEGSPLNNGALYAGGEVVVGQVVVKARAYAPGKRASLIATLDLSDETIGGIPGGGRITEAGEGRITEDGGYRINE